MNKVVKIIALISILAGITSCTKDTLSGSPDSFVPEGYIRTTLDLSVEKPGQIQTRATEAEEEAYDDTNVWALLFNATAADDATPTTLVQAPVKAIKSGNQLRLLLRATADPVTLHLVTGLSDELNAYLGTLDNFSEGVTTFEDVNQRLQTAEVTEAGVPVGPDTYFHMSIAPEFYPNGTINLTTITQDLIRNPAKINVDASALFATDFTLEGVTLVNGARKGFVLPQTAIPADQGGSTVRYDEKTTITDNRLTSAIYLYENAGLRDGAKNPTKLIIRGKYKGGASSYYRMDILEKDKNTDGTYIPHNITRNTSYTLIISKIENGGYSTFDEALAAEPSNTWYEVVVDDPNAYDVVSNGHYFLGISNSRCYVVGSAERFENLHVATVTTNAPAGTSTSIEIGQGPEGGLSLVTSSLTTPVTGTTTVTEIYATILRPDLTGPRQIDLKVGNLTHHIEVALLSDGPNSGTGVAYGDASIATGSVARRAEVVSGTEWVRVSTQSTTDFNLCPVSVVNPAGAGIWIRYNSTLDMNDSRSAEVYSYLEDDSRYKYLLFAAEVTYVEGLPTNVDKGGTDVNGVSIFTATFRNPGGYPFSVGIFTEGSATPLMETETNALPEKPIDLDCIKVTDGLVNLPRRVELKYKVNGNWYDAGQLLQRTFLNVHILSVGENALNIDDGTPNFGTQLGPIVSDNYFSKGIGKLLYQHTGNGKPIENGFKLFNLNHGGTNNGPNAFANIGKVLRDNNIDILYCSLNTNMIVFPDFGGPNPSQAEEILNWLDENPYRGMVFAIDQDNTNQEITKALFGVSHTSAGGSASPYSKLLPNDPYYNHPVHKAIMQGSYSSDPSLHAVNPIDLRETPFSNVASVHNNYSGGVPLTSVTAAGFIPIFNITINNVEYVLFAVHPTRNIVMMGDRSWFDSSIGFLNQNGSLNATVPGNYPKMIMNMWEWYINNVALGGNNAGRYGRK